MQVKSHGKWDLEKRFLVKLGETERMKGIGRDYLEPGLYGLRRRD